MQSRSSFPMLFRASCNAAKYERTLTTLGFGLNQETILQNHLEFFDFTNFDHLGIFENF